MFRARLLIGIVLLAQTLTGFGQEPVRFRGHLVHNKSKTLGRVEVRMESLLEISNDDGYFDILLPAGTSEARLDLPDKKLVIIYPRGGRILIPADPSKVTEIIIGETGELETLSVYLEYSRRIERSVGSSTEEIELLRTRLDSITNLLVKTYQLKESDLRNAVALQETKDKHYAEISHTLQTYYGNAVDLKNAFKYIADFAFENAEALTELKQAIEAYNPSYEKLNAEYPGYEQNILTYWESKELADNLHNVVDYALNDIHESRAMPLNELVRKINDYFQSGRRNDAARERIIADIHAVLPSMENSLSVLNERINTLLPKLLSPI